MEDFFVTITFYFKNKIFKCLIFVKTVLYFMMKEN